MKLTNKELKENLLHRVECYKEDIKREKKCIASNLEKLINHIEDLKAENKNNTLVSTGVITNYAKEHAELVERIDKLMDKIDDSENIVDALKV